MDLLKVYDFGEKIKIFKLGKVRIKGNFLEFIRSMYTSPKGSRIYKSHVTKPFSATVELKKETSGTAFSNLFII